MEPDAINKFAGASLTALRSSSEFLWESHIDAGAIGRAGRGWISSRGRGSAGAV